MSSEEGKEQVRLDDEKRDKYLTFMEGFRAGVCFLPIKVFATDEDNKIYSEGWKVGRDKSREASQIASEFAGYKPLEVKAI